MTRGAGQAVEEYARNHFATEAVVISADGKAPSNAKESAMARTLSPGNYTALVRGVGGSTGTALVEVYDESASP